MDSGEELIARVEAARQAVDILGQRLNMADGKFNTLEYFTLEETDSISKDLEGHQRVEFEIKEVITFLECELMYALSTIETMRAGVKELREGMKVGGPSSFD